MTPEERIAEILAVDPRAPYAKVMIGMIAGLVRSAEREAIEKAAKVADRIASEAKDRRDSSKSDDAVQVHESHRVTAAFCASSIRSLMKTEEGK
jgi:choline-glycine betaine transporter